MRQRRSSILIPVLIYAAVLLVFLVLIALTREGRCAIEKRSILISDVPADYIRIRSGMGEHLPSSILLVPIMFDEEVLGVIELASFGEIEPYKIRFLESLGRSAGR